MTCIGNSAGEAQDLFERPVDLLDAQAEGGAHGVPESMFDNYLTME
jgi:hypothetical protein